MSRKSASFFTNLFRLLVLTVLLAACGNSGTQTTTNPAATQGANAPTMGAAQTTGAAPAQTTGAATTTGAGGADAGATKDPVRVGIITSQTGPLATYGAQYLEGFRIGLDYATKGTGIVAGHQIEVTEQDDAGDPAKAVTAAKDLIGQGFKILAGSASSGVAVQVAPLAEQNQVLFISGPAATDAITGINKNTFRSGRQTYQDILTASTFIGDLNGKKISVFAQDTTFGQANVAAVKAVMGAKGATVDQILVPSTATDVTPFAQQAKQAKPDLLFVAWAGTTAPAMWQSLDQQGVFADTTIVTGLDIRASYPTFGPAASKIQFLSHFFNEATDNPANTFLREALQKDGKVPDLFHPDGFNAALMVARAIEQTDGADVAAMITALEGYSFEGPKGQMTIRAEDHAMLQPMFQANLAQSGTDFAPKSLKTLAPNDVAPPVTQK